MKRIGLPGLILLLFVLLLVVPSAVEYYTDWLWFRELGYEGVFLRTLNAQLARVRGDVRRRLPSLLTQSRPRAADVHPAADRHRHRRRRPRDRARRRPARAHRGAGDRRRSRGSSPVRRRDDWLDVAQFLQRRAVRRQRPALPPRRRPSTSSGCRSGRCSSEQALVTWPSRCSAAACTTCSRAAS